VTLAPEVPGTVSEVAFESGAQVAQGALLVRLDTTSEEAQLRAIEAQVQLATLNLERSRTLRRENTVAQAELDAAESALKEARANADLIRATIAKKTIRAPFAGQVGIRQVNLGEYVEVGRPIVSIQALATVYAEFSLPQQELARVATGMVVRLTSDTYPGRRFQGTLTAINPDLDPATRSVGLQASFDNADHALRPGMFAAIEVVLPQERPVVVIPATSVLSAPYGDSVYVIDEQQGADGKPALTARQQFIRTGRSRGDFVSVDTGLKAGLRIVSAGLFKVRNGMAVVENNELAPASSAAPRPPDT
jgi:membrane fusion protein (multidrug efflux system)